MFINWNMLLYYGSKNEYWGFLLDMKKFILIMKRKRLDDKEQNEIVRKRIKFEDVDFEKDYF